MQGYTWYIFMLLMSKLCTCLACTFSEQKACNQEHIAYAHRMPVSLLETMALQVPCQKESLLYLACKWVCVHSHRVEAEHAQSLEDDLIAILVEQGGPLGS